MSLEGRRRKNQKIHTLGYFHGPLKQHHVTILRNARTRVGKEKHKTQTPASSQGSGNISYSMESSRMRDYGRRFQVSKEENTDFWT